MPQYADLVARPPVLPSLPLIIAVLSHTAHRGISAVYECQQLVHHTVSDSSVVLACEKTS